MQCESPAHWIRAPPLCALHFGDAPIRCVADRVPADAHSSPCTLVARHCIDRRHRMQLLAAMAAAVHHSSVRLFCSLPAVDQMHRRGHPWSPQEEWSGSVTVRQRAESLQMPRVVRVCVSRLPERCGSLAAPPRPRWQVHPPMLAPAIARPFPPFARRVCAHSPRPPSLAACRLSRRPSAQPTGSREPRLRAASSKQTWSAQRWDRRQHAVTLRHQGRGATCHHTAADGTAERATTARHTRTRRRTQGAQRERGAGRRTGKARRAFAGCSSFTPTGPSDDLHNGCSRARINTSHGVC